MRNVKKNFTLLLIATTVLFTNCSKDYDYSSTTTTEEVLARSQWSVENYQIQNQTMPFGDYRLLFTSNGKLTVKNGNEIIAGTWASSINTNNQKIINFNLNTTDASLIALNKSWKIIALNSSSVLFELNDAGNTCLLRIKKEY